jgi:hypothetical protein
MHERRETTSSKSLSCWGGSVPFCFASRFAPPLPGVEFAAAAVAAAATATEGTARSGEAGRRAAVVLLAFSIAFDPEKKKNYLV